MKHIYEFNDLVKKVGIVPKFTRKKRGVFELLRLVLEIFKKVIQYKSEAHKKINSFKNQFSSNTIKKTLLNIQLFQVSYWSWIHLAWCCQ